MSQGAYDDSDKALGIDLGAEYQELYVRYKIKFSPTWQWGTNGIDGDSPQWKLGHVQRHVYGENPSSYFTNYDCRNSPVALPSIGAWLGGVPATVDDIDPVYLKWNARCFAGTGGSCTSENYRCVGHDAWAQEPGQHYYPRTRYTLGNIGSNSLIDGQWHTIEFRLKTNTYSNDTWQTDGRYQTWLDGILVIDRTSVEVFFGDASYNPPRGYSLVSIGGNNNNDFTKSEDTVDGEQWYVFDDFVVSTEYVGPDYIIGGSSSTRADVDQSSSINSTDALLTLRNSLGLDMPSTNWHSSATTGDVNCDNITNATDALLILKYSLGLNMNGIGWCG